MTEGDSAARWALCIGHPGHELQVFGWLQEAKPLVFVLTDGSGASSASRLESTARLLEESGARPGVIFGPFTDRAFYTMMRERNLAGFLELAEGLCDELEKNGIDAVAGDMLEGFSTTHDVCRVLINAAVEKLRRRSGVAIRNYEFALDRMRGGASTGAGSGSDARVSPVGIEVYLDQETFEKKRVASLEHYPEIASEVERLVDKFGEEAFRREVLTPADEEAGLEWDRAEPPFYETYGRRRIEAGHYQSLITFSEHLQPIARALKQWALS